MGLVIGIVGGLSPRSPLPGGVAHGNLSPAATWGGGRRDGDSGSRLRRRRARARRRASRRRDPRQFGLRDAPRSALARGRDRAGGAGRLPRLLAAAWFAALHTSGEEKEFVKEIGGNAGTISVLAVCALTCIVAPICEELLFRGFIFRTLSNWRGPWPAALATGALFGLVHGLSAPAVDLLPLALLGVVLCLLYQWTGSLYPCIAVHMINNAIALGSDESWGTGRVVALMAGALAGGALVLIVVRLASDRWTPATG